MEHMKMNEMKIFFFFFFFFRCIQRAAAVANDAQQVAIEPSDE